MSANDKQVGGDHYSKDGEQHWDRMYRLYGRGYFVGCATKYIERYHLKNGRQDLEKAIHFIQKLIELEYTLVENDTHVQKYEYATPNTDDLVKKYPDDYQEQLAAKMSKMREDAMIGIPDHLRAEMTRPMFDKSFGDLIIKSSKEIVDYLNNLQPEKEYVSPMLKNFWGGEEPPSQGYVNQDGNEQYPSSSPTKY